MNLTRDQVKLLGRRAQQPKAAPGELVAIFVNRPLVNTKNARLHPMAEHRYKSGWREAVALALLEAGWKLGGSDAPKRIHFVCRVAQRMDSQDGLRVACAPIVDALGECGVLTGRREKPGRGDEDERGHQFTYEQVIDRARRGVEIRVRLVEAAP